MTSVELDQIFKRIESTWSASGARLDFIEVMRQALFSHPHRKSKPESDTTQWALLPGLCCQAAGGDPAWADRLAAAWMLFYVAAHLMDSVEDGDELDGHWKPLSSGAVLNAASGLFFSASLELNNLYRDPSLAAAEIVDDFHRTFLQMCDGQHRDLVTAELNLCSYWEVAALKSGIFFSLACRSGARLGTTDYQRVDGFSRFGRNLGTLIQIHDDLEDLLLPQDGPPSWRSGIFRSLPVVYTLEVSPPEQAERLRKLLNIAPNNLAVAEEALSMIELSGAALYALAEIERFSTQAIEALEITGAQQPARDALLSLLNSLIPK